METAYFVAGPEAVALIASAVEARLAYRERIREVSKRIGATGTMVYAADQVAHWILPYGAPIPEGWKRAPRVQPGVGPHTVRGRRGKGTRDAVEGSVMTFETPFEAANAALAYETGARVRPAPSEG